MSPGMRCNWSGVEGVRASEALIETVAKDISGGQGGSKVQPAVVSISRRDSWPCWHCWKKACQQAIARELDIGEITVKGPCLGDPAQAGGG